MTLIGIIVATFASEDLTCIGVGVAISQGKLDWTIGLLGCYVGILAGDFGLWLLGRFFGVAILRNERIRRRLPTKSLDGLGAWFDRNGGKAVFTARFVPGARFPIYVGAGALGRKAGPFVAIAALAGLIWTPVLVGVVALIGEPIVAPLESFFRHGWMAIGAAALLLFFLFALIRSLSTFVGRAKWKARVSRVWRWEFWPMWLFYLPLIPYVCWLSLRHGGFRTITAANPCMPHGGIIGESKHDIMQRLPADWAAKSVLIDATDSQERGGAIERLLNDGWSFPLILKPDVGERGAAVAKVDDLDDALRYMGRGTWPVLVQPYVAGPHEAGVFYYRYPNEPAGRIFSITDKVFSHLECDGESTIERLIWRHPRYRMQAKTFLDRLGDRAGDVPPRGERVQLAVAGNHCQGTMFRDGTHLITPELEKRIDEISRSIHGFYFGRFDVRYADGEALREGRDFTIIELNGVSSESTNIYDPTWPILPAYRVLFKQWRILFEIGARRTALGSKRSSWRELFRLIRKYCWNRTVPVLSD